MSTMQHDVFAGVDDLGSFFRTLIASELKMAPQEVTLQFIVDDRETRFYPNAVYSIGSAYGGYRFDYLPVLSRNQFDAIEREIDAATQLL